MYFIIVCIFSFIITFVRALLPFLLLYMNVHRVRFVFYKLINNMEKTWFYPNKNSYTFIILK